MVKKNGRTAITSVQVVNSHYGKFKMRIALARAGPIQIELMQPLHGETIYDEFAQRRGYGLHHLGIKTDNMEQSVKEMQEKGFQVIQRWHHFR